MLVSDSPSLPLTQPGHFLHSVHGVNSGQLLEVESLHICPLSLSTIAVSVYAVFSLFIHQPLGLLCSYLFSLSYSEAHNPQMEGWVTYSKERPEKRL